MIKMCSTYAPFNRDYDDLPRKQLIGTVTINIERYNPNYKRKTAKNFWDN